MMKATLEERLISKVERRANGCWEFMGCRQNMGYGLIYWRNRVETITTHKLSWMLFRGEIPEGMQVLHHCDNPPCCNPDHLFLGTQRDNIHDMIKKGRYKGGFCSPVTLRKAEINRGATPSTPVHLESNR